MKKLVSLVLLVVALGAASTSYANGNSGNCNGGFSANNCNNDYSITDNSVTNKGGNGGEGGSVRDSGNSRVWSSNRQSQIGINKQGQDQSQYQGNIGVNKAVGTGNKTSVTIGGDKFEAAATSGSVSNHVAYECGGTAGAYVGLPGATVGGGGAFAFETCEDVFVARSAMAAGLTSEGQTFMAEILERRLSQFRHRNDGYKTVTVLGADR